MPLQTKIFRVFVSSTFTDMKEERKILQKEVFPKLEKFCESNGAKFQVVDLRWGVNEESSLNQKTLQICFNEIDRCQRISPKPNFLILLGNKYGWQPIPEIIPYNEMSLILYSISSNDKELIKKWYWIDTNAVPQEYVLQPKEKLINYQNETDEDFDKREYMNWKLIEDEIRLVLRRVVTNNDLAFLGDQKSKYLNSATHQEILRGALNPPEDGEKPEEHVFAFIRKIDGLPEDNSAKNFIDRVDGNPDNYSIAQLNDLKTELKAKLGDHCITRDATWSNDKSELDDSPAIGSVFKL